MTSPDAAWLRMDRATNPMVINSVLWFDEPVDWERCRATFRERVVDRFDRFRQRPAEGPAGFGTHWEDVDDFDMELHFHRVALPAPGDRRALQELVSDRASVPLDRSRPLWDVYLIDGLGPGAAVLARMHHSIADGIALARVMLGLADGGTPDGPDFVSRAGRDSTIGTLARAAGALAQEGAEAVLHPRHALELAATAIEDVRTLGKLLLPWSDPQTAIKGEQHVRHRVAWSQPVELRLVKRTARALGATVNDVLVAAVAAAVGDYLRGHGDDVEAVHALVPFNLRSLDEPLPRELGNRFGLVVLPLPIGVDDPVLRAIEVKRQMDAIKHGHEGPIAYGILGLIGRTPAELESRLVDYFSAKGSMVLTNVPGPQRTLTVAGTPLRGVLVWAPCAGTVGMSVTVFSYAGKVTVGFLTDAGLVPDPDTLADGFRDELLALAATPA